VGKLNHKLTRLEQSTAEMLPDQERCPCCHGATLSAFSDEPDNAGPRFPYDGPGGTCRRCRMPPPGTRLIPLSAPLAKCFAGLPWADDRRVRFHEKLLLFIAMHKRDAQEVERILSRMYQRDASGERHTMRMPTPKSERAATFPKGQTA